MEVKLTIHRIGDSEREVVLTKFPAVIGRSDTADVHLDDHYVSRRHCEIYEINDVPAIRDLNSRNGTYVNGIRIAEALLLPRSTISIGSLSIDVSSEPTRETSSVEDGEPGEMRNLQRHAEPATPPCRSNPTDLCRQNGRLSSVSPFGRLLTWRQRQTVNGQKETRNDST